MSHQTNILLEAGTNEVEIVVFTIDEALDDGTTYSWLFGVNVAKVVEIIRIPSFTAMPEVPHPSVLGAFNQRARIIPLLDLGVWLGIPPTRTTNDKVLVTEFNRVITAFKVSGVDRIHRLSWERIESPTRQMSRFSQESVIGVIRLESQVVLILDLEKIVGELNPKTAMDMGKATVDTEHAVVYKALVVDDSPTVRRLIKQLLEQAGFEVRVAFNGREAWDWLQECKEEIRNKGAAISDFLQVVVSDIEMPMMDGHSLTRRIKEDSDLKRIPVILFSSLISESLRHKGEAVGADLQVAKPDLGAVANAARELIHQNFGM